MATVLQEIIKELESRKGVSDYYEYDMGLNTAIGLLKSHLPDYRKEHEETWDACQNRITSSGSQERSSVKVIINPDKQTYINNLFKEQK